MIVSVFTRLCSYVFHACSISRKNLLGNTRRCVNKFIYQAIEECCCGITFA